MVSKDLSCSGLCNERERRVMVVVVRLSHDQGVIGDGSHQRQLLAAPLEDMIFNGSRIEPPQ